MTERNYFAATDAHLRNYFAARAPAPPEWWRPYLRTPHKAPPLPAELEDFRTRFEPLITPASFAGAFLEGELEDREWWTAEATAIREAWHLVNLAAYDREAAAEELGRVNRCATWAYAWADQMIAGGSITATAEARPAAYAWTDQMIAGGSITATAEARPAVGLAPVGLTPGRWTFDGETVGVGSRVLARCGTFLQLPAGERLANGRAMAAAPALIEALAGALPSLAGADWNRAVAALAKAGPAFGPAAEDLGGG